MALDQFYRNLSFPNFAKKQPCGQLYYFISNYVLAYELIKFIL